MKMFIDPDFQAHRGIAQLSGELVLQLSTHTKLPFRPHRLALLLQNAYDQLGPALNDIPTGDGMLGKHMFTLYRDAFPNHNLVLILQIACINWVF